MAKFSVIGAGAVGGYYGAKLAAAGHNVTFVFRRDTELIRSQGFTVKSGQGDIDLDQPRCVSDSSELEPADYVIVAVKATANAAVTPLIQKILTSSGTVLLIQNGINCEPEYALGLGPNQSVVGGLAMIAAERTAPNIVEHYALGALTVGSYADNYVTAPDSKQPHELARLLIEAGVPTHIAPNLLSARWQKLLWNGSFNPISVLADMNTYEMTQDPHIASLVRRVMNEYLQAAQADGCDGLTDVDCDMMFQSSVHMAPYSPSMKVDFDHGRLMESEAIIGEPLKRAAATNTAMPATQAIYELISARNPH